MSCLKYRPKFSLFLAVRQDQEGFVLNSTLYSINFLHGRGKGEDGGVSILLVMPSDQIPLNPSVWVHINVSLSFSACVLQSIT
jgi:hypothetical protein